MNPFKIKALEDFTIADCEAYLSRYPYGEHSVEVKDRMKGLKKGIIKVEEKESKLHKPVHNSPVNNKECKEQASKENRNKDKRKNVVQKRDYINKKKQTPQKPVNPEEKSVIDTVLWWVGVIVIVLIVGTIIIYLLDLLLPEGTFQYIQKRPWIVYGICLLISKCFDKN